MKGGFRQSMSWLHTWVGLTLGCVLYFIFITGSASYFYSEIDQWMEPELPFVKQALPQGELLQMAEQYFNKNAPEANEWFVRFPVAWNEYLSLQWEIPNPDFVEGAPDEAGEDHRDGEVLLHPQTGEEVTAQARMTGGGGTLFEMHYALHYLPFSVVVWIISVASMFMLVGLISGTIVHKKIFKEFFIFRPNKKQRSWLDMHNTFSVLALPFYLMITYSGLLIFVLDTMSPIIFASYEDGAQSFVSEFRETYPGREETGIASVMLSPQILFTEAEQRWGKDQINSMSFEHLNDRNATVTLTEKTGSDLLNPHRLIFDGVTSELLFETPPASSAWNFRIVIFNLHFARFAGIILRWLFFFSGLLGAGMVATGLILWTVKRRSKMNKSGIIHRGLVLVERFNVGIIVGLPIAIAIYFWANRLISVNFEGRAEWEVHAMFITWGLTLIYPVFRSMKQAWFELLSLAALTYFLLPFLNLLTTNRHLGISIPQGDWVMASFDLTMLAFGIIFAMAAIKLNKKKSTEIQSSFINTNKEGNNPAPVELSSS